jgi:hypothetical protein
MVDSAAPPAPAVTAPSRQAEPSVAPAVPLAIEPEAKPSVMEEPKPSVELNKPEEPAPTNPVENAAPVDLPVTPALPVAEPPKVIDNPVADPVVAPATKSTDIPPPAKDDSKKQDAVDDLFGEGPATTPVVEKPATETPSVKTPATTNESLDDVFGGKADSAIPPTDAPKVNPPATNPPADINNLDSLFGEPTTPNPETKPTTKDAVDDLFGEPVPTKESPAVTPPAAKPPATDSSIDDLFGKPVSTDEKLQSTGGGLFDDLFEPKKPANAPTEAPSKTPAAPKNNSDELDKLFGVGSFTAPKQFIGAEFKVWVDNTGTYTVKGRLAVIYSDKIKLLKENGKFTTVSLDRLSDRDFEYVQWVASNLSQEKSTKFVKKESVNSETGNVR